MNGFEEELSIEIESNLNCGSLVSTGVSIHPKIRQLLMNMRGPHRLTVAGGRAEGPSDEITSNPTESIRYDIMKLYDVNHKDTQIHFTI